MSARELADGVQLNPRSAPYFLDREAGRPQITSHHYSLHNSPQSLGNQFKDTQTLSDGRKITAPLFTFGIRNGLFTPLFSRASTRMDDPHYSVRRRPRDSYISLGSYDLTRIVLVTTVVVSASSVVLPARDRLEVFAVDIGPYRISMIRDALQMPSTIDGSFLLVATGPMRTDQGISTQFLQEPGLTVDEVYEMHNLLKERGRQYLLWRIDTLSKQTVPAEYRFKSQDGMA